MSEQHVVNLLKISNSDNDNNNNNLPAVEHRYERLKQEINSLEIRKLNSNKDLQDLRKRISTSRNALDSCDLTYRQQAEKIARLQAKKMALEDLVRRFENNNEEYLKINQTIKNKVSSTLRWKGLLRLALYSLIESIRNEPVKYGSLICYYNNNNNLSSSTITTDYSSQYYGASYGQQHDYFMEAQIDMLYRKLEKLYNKQ